MRSLVATGAAIRRVRDRRAAGCRDPRPQLVEAHPRPGGCQAPLPAESPVSRHDAVATARRPPGPLRSRTREGGERHVSGEASGERGTDAAHALQRVE